MAATQIQRVSHRHDAIIDFLLGNPDVKDLHVLCNQLNVSRSWLSVVMRSDAFRAEYQRRRGEYNQDLAENVQRKLLDASMKSLEKLLGALDDDDLDPRFVLDAVDKTTAKLGFGAKAGAGPAVEIHQNTLQVVDSDLLKTARESMKRVNHTPLLISEDE